MNTTLAQEGHQRSEAVVLRAYDDAREVWRTLVERRCDGKVEVLVRSVANQRYDVYRLVQIHHNAVVVQYGHGGNPIAAEHMYDIEDGGIHACGRDRVEGVVGTRVNVSADLEATQADMERRNLLVAVSRDEPEETVLREDRDESFLFSDGVFVDEREATGVSLDE
jgi:hypothetical protein